jgi:peptide/nickel transport system substrate-binding protein
MSRQRNDPAERLLHKKISRRAALGGMGAAFAAPFFLRGGSEAFGQTKGKISTLVVAIEEGDTRTLDPQGANELTVPVYLKIMYDQLVTFPGSEFGRVVKDFATTWSVSADGLTYVFNLNPNIRFSSGRTATPDDVVFSLKRQKYLKGPASWFQDGVASVEQTGPHQVTIKLTSVNPDWLFLLTSPFLSIADTSLMQHNGANDATNAATTDTARAWVDEHSAGSGPFVLEAWEHGSQLTMKRNPLYWGKPSPFERVVFRFAKDANTQRDLLVRGDAHIAVNLTPDLAAELASSKTVGIINIPSLGFPWIGLHVNHNPALKTPKSWEAIKYAIDYDGMAKIYRGGGQYLAGCIPPGLPNALPVAERFKQDIPRAKAALAAAGYPNGFAMQLSYASDHLYWNIPSGVLAQKIKSDLAQIGVTANLRPIPSSQESTDFRAGKLEADIHDWGADYIGWTDFLPVFAPGGHVAAPRQGWTPEFSADAKRIADLSAEAVKTLDPAKQQQLCYQAQRLMNQVGPYVWLFEANIQIGYRKDILKPMATNPVWFLDVGSVELV